MTDKRWYFLRLNPQPWESPNVGIGRRNGKPFPQVYKSAGLRAYQEAVRDLLGAMNVDAFDGNTLIDLTFYFWRRLPDYTTDRDRKARKHEADATNMQKALEDACQGILFPNDRAVHHVQSWIMEQGHDTEPLVAIEVSVLGPLPVIEIPAAPRPVAEPMPPDMTEYF